MGVLCVAATLGWLKNYRALNVVGREADKMFVKSRQKRTIILLVADPVMPDSPFLCPRLKAEGVQC